MHTSMDRVRVTISLTRELAQKIDDMVDGVRIRNRSHAIESLVTESLNLSHVKQAVILAGGQDAVDRLPAIRRMLGILQRYGVSDIIVAVGYLGAQIRQELGGGEQHGLRISYSESELGTGGALAGLKAKLKRTFFVINVDQPVDVDLPNLLRFHRSHEPLVTVATSSLRQLRGVYVIEPKLLNQIPAGFCTLEETVFDELTRQGRLLSYPLIVDHH